MKKIILTVSIGFIATSLLYACDCTASKNMMKCDYYVGLKHDKTHQKECIDFAKIRDKNFVYGSAARYYLIGGDLKDAKEAAKKAVKIGQNYAYEYLGLAYLMEKKIEKAKKAFSKLKIKDKKYMKKDIDILSSIYKDFNKKEAIKLLGLS